MKKIETPIAGVFIIEPVVHQDARGFLFESYNQAAFAVLKLLDEFVQDNHSFSRQGVLRGLHFQYPPRPMSKLVRCLRGRVFDVAVDARANSPTFKRWYGLELSAEDHRMLYLPAGCAHGFYALTDCEIAYKCGALFDPEFEGGFVYDDPEIGVDWPIIGAPLLSERDRHLPAFREIVGRLNAG